MSDSDLLDQPPEGAPEDDYLGFARRYVAPYRTLISWVGGHGIQLVIALHAVGFVVAGGHFRALGVSVWSLPFLTFLNAGILYALTTATAYWSADLFRLMVPWSGVKLTVGLGLFAIGVPLLVAINIMEGGRTALMGLAIYWLFCVLVTLFVRAVNKGAFFVIPEGKAPPIYPTLALVLHVVSTAALFSVSAYPSISSGLGGGAGTPVTVICDSPCRDLMVGVHVEQMFADDNGFVFRLDRDPSVFSLKPAVVIRGRSRCGSAG